MFFSIIVLFIYQSLGYTVKPVLSGHLKIDKIKILMDNGTLIKVKSIADSAILLTCINR